MNKNWRIIGLLALATSVVACGDDGTDDTGAGPTSGTTDASTGGNGEETAAPGDGTTGGADTQTTTPTTDASADDTGTAGDTGTSTACEAAPAVPTGDVTPVEEIAVLVDDFEDGDAASALNEMYWYTYAGEGTGSLCPPQESETVSLVAAGGPGESEYAGSVAVESVAVYAGFGVDLATAAAPLDLSGCEGVVFDIAGTGTTYVTLAQADLVPVGEGGACDLEANPTAGCGQTYRAEVELTEGWTQVAVPFADLVQNRWMEDSDEVAFDPSQVIKLQYQFDANASATVAVDNVGFYGGEGCMADVGGGDETGTSGGGESTGGGDTGGTTGGTTGA